ncbi:DEAD/DEAH box helicase [Pseudoxanthomonas sp. CAU 1598]|uniref:ATP-dependent RNA helicase DeaD n=1 Tax=Pseudomarimonas arenosa TaxID=2774145 RepID=A0AAW3ZRH2_9GAMM|nr:DEAD/DEAH box helicase [Pseudomarimonas arenosa]
MSRASSTDSEPTAMASFTSLGLAEPLLRSLSDVGYETPSPIQAATLPLLMQGRDVLGQAQTGTGKTAAFALPILHRLNIQSASTQALVLCPTRELAIQVAEAFQKYASHMRDFHVLPIYGGQAYGPQLKALKRGVQVVVGTPGRVIDHLERGTLDLSTLQTLVLDEADEMLRMGFVDDVEAVLKRLPEQRQIALFSATMPAPIRRLARTYLRDPEEVAIAAKTTTAENIRQRYWWVSGLDKLDALTRILEVETFDAMIIFTRTKQATEELAEKLSARGFSAAAINGDLAQAQRERTVQRLREGHLDILVATDVAARGLDVERISHVLNYDIPYDTESYVHRIGRTGRAGRQGEAILFVTPRERGMLRSIERATRQPIEQMSLPSVDAVNEQRVSKFLSRITDALGDPELAPFQAMIRRYKSEQNVSADDVAAALARLLQGEEPLLLPPEPVQTPRPERPRRGPPESGESARSAPPRVAPQEGYAMEAYRVEVGYQHGVKPGNLVGAIANEAGLESRFIGRIEIGDEYSLVDLPEGMPEELIAHMQGVWVSGQRLKMRKATARDELPSRGSKRPGGKRAGPGGPGGRGDDRGEGRPSRGPKPGGNKPDGYKSGGYKPGGFKAGGPKGGKRDR